MENQENKYTADKIASICKVSKQSIYSLIKKNRDFISENSTRIHRVVYYNQTAMDFFISYYLPEKASESGENPSNQNDIATVSSINPIVKEVRAPEGEPENPVELPVESPQAEEPPEAQPEALQRKIDALEAEISTLRKQLDDKEEERKELLRQNGALILTISQLQTEKQLLLPAPKRSIGERVKSLFHKS